MGFAHGFGKRRVEADAHRNAIVLSMEARSQRFLMLLADRSDAGDHQKLSPSVQNPDEHVSEGRLELFHPYNQLAQHGLCLWGQFKAVPAPQGVHHEVPADNVRRVRIHRMALRKAQFSFASPENSM